MSTQENMGVKKLLALGEQLTIETVVELHEQLCSCLSGCSDVSIDGSTIRVADTAGLQLLSAFRKTLQQTQRRVLWHEPSVELKAKAGELGLLESVGLIQETIN